MRPGVVNAAKHHCGMWPSITAACGQASLRHVDQAVLHGDVDQAVLHGDVDQAMLHGT